MFFQPPAICLLASIALVFSAPAPPPDPAANPGGSFSLGGGYGGSGGSGGSGGGYGWGEGACTGGNVAQVKSGSCRPGLVNTVFNVDVSEAVWDTIRQHGVSNFISFWMDGQETHPPPFKFTTMPTIKSESFSCARIPLALMSDDVGRAAAYVKSANPLFLGLYNEPDIPPGAPWKPTPAEQVGSDIKKALDAIAAAPGRTHFLHPGLFENDPGRNDAWYKKFTSTCPDCPTRLPIISLHIYEGDAQKTVQIVNSVVQRYPGHKIWITELSPRNNVVGCKHTVPTIVEWMKVVLRELNKIEAVEKIFWNNGEWGEMGECNVSLTGPDGQPTELLRQLGDEKLCDEPAAS